MTLQPAPAKAVASTCLTLFAGAGGADLGLRAAGFVHVGCVEVDADCCATLTAAGFPAIRAGIGGPYAAKGGTVAAFDPAPFVGVDLVWASPPCQPYSRAGKGLGADDSRDGWPATLDVLRVVCPRWVAVENVSGAPVEVWTADLESLGYTVSARTLDAADYGVAQNRVREFLVAGLHPIEWPRATHYGPKVPHFLRIGRAPWRSMADALPGRRFVGGGANPRFPGDARTERELTHEPSTTIAGPSGNCAPFVVDPKHPPCDPSRPAPTVPTVGNQYLHDSDVGVRSGPQSAYGRRRLTTEECAILQDFPPDYPFVGTKTSRYRMAGNAVCQTVARAIGRAVLKSAASASDV